LIVAKVVMFEDICRPYGEYFVAKLSNLGSALLNLKFGFACRWPRFREHVRGKYYCTAGLLF